jgi:SAM-dependent methyltransferase
LRYASCPQLVHARCDSHRFIFNSRRHTMAQLPPAVHECLQRALQTYNQSEEAILFNQTAEEDELQRRQLDAIIGALPDSGTLLDIGTGKGIIPHAVHLIGHTVISVDYPVSGGTAAVKRLTELGVRGVYAQVGVDPLPLSAESIDVAFAGDVIEHLHNSPKPFLAELVRVLKPGGMLMLTTPNATRLLVRVKLALGYSNWPPIEEFYDEEVNIHHHKEYTALELVRTLSRAGFQDTSVDFIEARIGVVPVSRLSDARTRRRFGRKTEKPGGVRAGLAWVMTRVGMAWVTARPTLASELLAKGAKPSGTV